MFNHDTSLLFSSRIIPSLRGLRGEDWETLLDQVLQLPSFEGAQLAFVYMMTEINGCTSCQLDSYKAMRGCTDCATHSITRFKGSDQELLERFEQARNWIHRKLGSEEKQVSTGQSVDPFEGSGVIKDE